MPVLEGFFDCSFNSLPVPPVNEILPLDLLLSFSLDFPLSLSFTPLAVRSSPNSLFIKVAFFLMNLRMSSNLGLEPDSKILPASSVYLALRKIGSFRLSSLRVFIWFKSLTYSGPISFNVRLVESKFLTNSSNDDPYAFFKFGKSTSFLM